jgi:hypothetical protein
LLTLLDEGGAIVQCDDAELIALVRGYRWKELFWEQRSGCSVACGSGFSDMRRSKQAMKPWPGIACKAIFVPFDADPDAATQAWLAALPADATPGGCGSVARVRLPGLAGRRQPPRPSSTTTNATSARFQGKPGYGRTCPQAPPRDAARLTTSRMSSSAS